jgi:tetratricopeptide (TPR) repeat protein
MLKFKTIILIFALNISVIPSYASLDGGNPGDFLRRSIGANGGAIGYSYAAITNGADSIFYNPAAISLATKPEMNFSRTWLFENTDYTFLGFIYPHKNHGFGIGFIRQYSSDYERRINPYDSPSSFSISNEAFIAAYSIKSPFDLFPAQFGINLKGIRYKIDTYSDMGYGADFAFNAKPAKNLNLSFVLYNFLKPELKLVSKEITYSQGFNLAMAYKYKVNRDMSVQTGISALKYESQDKELSLGAKLSYKKRAFLQAGYSSQGFSSGIGIKAGNYETSYSMVFHEIEPVHTIGFTMRFGMTTKELQEYIQKGINKFNKEDAARLADVYMRQAEIFYKAKKYIKAESTAENALLLKPSDKTIVKKVEFYKKENKIRLNKQMIDRMVFLAQGYYEKMDFIESRKYWQKVLELDSSNMEARKFMVRIAKSLSQEEKNRLKEDKNQQLQEKADKIVFLASKYLKQKKYSKALRSARKALKYMPADAAAKSIVSIASQGMKIEIKEKWNKAMRFFNKKSYAEALVLFKEILKEEPFNKAAAKKIKECESSFKSVISIQDKKKIEKLYYMAVDSYLKNKFNDSRKYLDDIFKINPLNETARKLKEKLDKVSGNE